MSRQTIPTVDEIIALLQRSSLPTIIVEGKNDMIVYRRFEQSGIELDVLAAGGRANVLNIFRRRNEIAVSKKIVFVADQDIWINFGIPDEFRNPKLVFTHGYSIENDVFIDGNLENLVPHGQSATFREELNKFVKWYASALIEHKNNSEISIKIHPNEILKNPACIYQDGYDARFYESILMNYKMKLRGKSLFGLLLRNTGTAAKYNDITLLTMVAIRPGELLNRLLDRLKRELN